MKGETVVSFYRHWYLDELGYPKCSDWQYQDWWDYVHSWHRDAEDMGDDNPLKLLHTDRRYFIIKDKK